MDTLQSDLNKTHNAPFEAIAFVYLFLWSITDSFWPVKEPGNS